MDTLLPALMLGAAPLAGLVLFIARAMMRTGRRTTALALGWMSVVGTALTIVAMIAAYEGSSSAGGFDLSEASIVYFFCGYLVIVTILVIQALRNVLPPSPDYDIELQVGAYAWLLIFAPLTLIAAFPLLVLLLFSYLVFSWHRWRRVKQACLLTLLNGVVEVNRPVRSVFRPTGRKSRWWAKRVDTFSNDIRDGLTYSDAAEHAGVIANEDVDLLRAAELANAVERELPRMARSARSRMRETWAVTGTMGPLVYIQTLATLFLCIIGFLMYWIVPKFKFIFEDFGVELPQITYSFFQLADTFVSTMHISTTGVACWLTAILATALIAIGGTRSLPTWALSRGPRRWSSPTVFHVLSTFIESGVPLTEPLIELAQRAKTPFWSKRWQELATATSTGVDIGRTLVLNGDLTLQESNGLTAAAQTGKLAGQAAFLRSTAIAIEDRSRRFATKLNSVLSFILFAFIAWLCAFAAIAFLICIVKMVNELS